MASPTTYLPARSHRPCYLATSALMTHPAPPNDQYDDRAPNCGGYSDIGASVFAMLAVSLLAWKWPFAELEQLPAVPAGYAVGLHAWERKGVAHPP